MNNDKIEDILNKIGNEKMPEDIRKIAQKTSNDFMKQLAQSQQPKQHLILEFIMKSKISKLAAAAVVVIGVSLFTVFFPGQNKDDWSIFATACAKENALFMGENIVHIQNEVIIYKAADDSDESDPFRNSVWLPMTSLKADGQLMFNQLNLPVQSETYTVYDHSWYEPATGKFIRILKTDEKIVFADSYDGQFIYTSQTGSDGTFQLNKQAIDENFKPPLKPATFLGLGANINQDDPLIQEVTEGTLEGDISVKIFKTGTPGQSQAYWLFIVRDDDGTIAEKEFVVSDEPRLTIRRIFAESVLTAEYSWNLNELEGLNVAADAGQQISIIPDMIKINVSVKDMVEQSSMETYVFADNPSWTKPIQIIDLLDIASPGERAFIFAARADDGRHLVMVQIASYNIGLADQIKTGTLTYTSPNGFKVWSGGPKNIAEILLISARSVVIDPPSDDCVAYGLESPAGTYPVLAINGPISDEELHNLVDSLIPARDYIEK